MKKIMITGSEGFIGKHLVHNLERENKYKILKFDIKLSPFHDIRQFLCVYDFMKKHKPDIIIHLAANPDTMSSVEFPLEDLVLNAGGTINVLEAARRIGVELVIFTSTAQVYGEPQSIRMNEEHRLHPKGPYAAGKLGAERYCVYYHEKFNLPVVIFRFFNIYGEGQVPYVVIPSLIKKISQAEDSIEMFGSREDSRDFTYVGDLCDAFLRTIEKKPVGEIINFGSGKELSIYDLAKLIAELLGKEVDFVYSGEKDDTKISRMMADVSKAKRLLGWEAKIPITEGVKKVMLSMGVLE